MLECEFELRMIKRWKETGMIQLNSNVNKRFKDKDRRGEIEVLNSQGESGMQHETGNLSTSSPRQVLVSNIPTLLL